MNVEEKTNEATKKIMKIAQRDFNLDINHPNQWIRELSRRLEKSITLYFQINYYKEMSLGKRTLREKYFDKIQKRINEIIELIDMLPMDIKNDLEFIAEERLYSIDFQLIDEAERQLIETVGNKIMKDNIWGNNNLEMNDLSRHAIVPSFFSLDDVIKSMLALSQAMCTYLDEYSHSKKKSGRIFFIRIANKIIKALPSTMCKSTGRDFILTCLKILEPGSNNDNLRKAVDSVIV